MFWASPTETMISANSDAVFTFINLTEACAAGWTLVAPPTIPTAMGISSVPTRLPSASLPQVESEVYLPERAA